MLRFWLAGGESLPPGEWWALIRMRALAAHPDLSPLEVLLLPDRHDLLQAIYGEPAPIKGFASMRSRDCDCDRDFADLDHSDSVADGYPFKGKSTVGLHCELSHLFEGH